MNSKSQSFKSAGIYIHIPFCVSKCHYCDFYSVPKAENLIAEFIDCIHSEIESASLRFAKECEVNTIYFGGGTPSILPAESLVEILNSVKSDFFISDSTEITLEANPESVTTDELKLLRQAGFNRISIGVQSFENKDLLFLRRVHDSDQALNAVKVAQNTGFANISIDLMFAIPEQSIDTAISNIEKAATLEVKHISLYGLTSEPGTPLGKSVEDGLVTLPDGDRYADFYLNICDKLRSLGYQKYEISNFAKPGYECGHNLNYWNYGTYFGFGPSGHSAIIDCNQNRLRVERFWNIRDLQTYIKCIRSEESTVETKEILNDKQIRLEKLQLQLRQQCGIAITEIMMDKTGSFREYLEILAGIGHVIITPDERIILTDEGAVVADELILNLSNLIITQS
ncbi:MAG: radical SAM family heme chaperone HemW [candidate division Zixibacteria bacterium]|nr:radical SAM family heme chaperone HemW [candidate division Zixibacteria bacterium]